MARVIDKNEGDERLGDAGPVGGARPVTARRPA